MLRETENSPRQRARLKACRLRGGDACPCDWTECRIYAASFTDILRLRDREDEEVLCQCDADTQAVEVSVDTGATGSEVIAQSR